MDEQRFDAALRALQAGTTRRAGLAGALGVLLGGRAGALAGDAAHPRTDRNRAQAGTESGTWSYRAKFGTRNVWTPRGDSNFNRPQGVFVSADGKTAWVADTDNNRISIWTRPATSSTSWSYRAKFGTRNVLHPRGDSNFYPPQGVFVSADGKTAWVADTNNDRISIWTRPSTSSTSWSYSAKFGTKGDGNSNFSKPVGVSVSADTLTAWVADSGNNRISIWTRPNNTSRTWSYSNKIGIQGDGSGSLEFDTPYDVFVSADTLSAWVADSGNNRICKWTRDDPTSNNARPDWLPHSEEGGNYLNGPRGVFVVGATLWIVDSGNNRIAIWTRDIWGYWLYSTEFGTKGDGNSNFSNPSRVFVSADSLTAWVADTDNHRISIWTQG